MANLGNVGNPSTLIWLYCDLQTYGKTIIRQGWREGLPQDKPSIWAFCPLLKGKFPRDRTLVEGCKKCEHFKGLSQPIENINRNSGSLETPFKCNMIKKKPHITKKVFSDEDIKKESEEKKQLDKEWEEEEKKLFGKKVKGR